MDNNVSQGVRILVERCETNPDEMMEEYGKWSQLRNAVFDYMENRGNTDRHAWLRGLREDEIKLLYDAFGANYRRVFDEYVMKNVLVDEEDEKDKQWAAIKNPGMFHNKATFQPGSWQNVATQISNTSVVSQQSLVARLKQELGIK